MHAAYQARQSRYFVVEMAGTVMGCGGFAPLQNSEPSQAIAELRKMYFLPPLRDHGIGRRFLTMLLKEMRDCGFRRVYLETDATMKAAQSLYRSMGFDGLDHPIGKTGHSACQVRLVRDL